MGVFVRHFNCWGGRRPRSYRPAIDKPIAALVGFTAPVGGQPLRQLAGQEGFHLRSKQPALQAGRTSRCKLDCPPTGMTITVPTGRYHSTPGC